MLQAESIADVKEKVINDEIYEFSRGSHEEQVQYIEKNFHIQIIKHWKRWPDFIEIFERRNLVAHGEQKFTKRYVEICKKHEHKGSEKLYDTKVELTPAYLRQSVDTLLEFSILVIFTLWKKHFPDQGKGAYASINEVAFRLILNKRYTVAIRVLEHTRSLVNTKAPEDVKLMMIVNLASAYKHNKNSGKCVEVLDSIDWSASSDNYKLCVSALREDLQEFSRLMLLSANAGSVKKDHFKDWPVFNFVRKTKEFEDGFQTLFGESPRREEPAAAVEILEGDANIGSPEDKMVH